MEPWVAGRQVAAAAESLRDLAQSARLDDHPGAYAVPVRCRPLQRDRDGMASRRPVVEINQWLVLGDQDGVDAPVVVQVADGQAPADVGDEQGRTGPRGDVTQ